MTSTETDISQLAVDTIRTLSMDAVQAANSGHPGTPMALAPVAYVLWNEFLRFDPANPEWAGRDRFVLSCGHASMLLYSLLHLADVRRADGGPAVSLDDVKSFRQLGRPTAGHPEHGDAPGIETTTGPLGQGVGNSVGFAAAARFLGTRWAKHLEYDVWTLCSDGDVMEGVGCEAASLAGHLRLSNLCWVWDDNRITIEGETDLAFTEDVPARFRALGWNVVEVADANDLDALRAAFQAFRSCDDKPTFIVVRSVIGWGAPTKAGKSSAHGSPPGDHEVRGVQQSSGWPEDARFLVPEGVREHFAAGIGKRGRACREVWEREQTAYANREPERAVELQQLFAGELPRGWDAEFPSFPADAKGKATRVSSGEVLRAAAARIPWMLGGSADLAPSTNTLLKGEAGFQAGAAPGRNFHFGVREHAMAACANGLALAGFRPFVATFFVFSDYLRPSLRLSAIMHLPVLYVLTHDSIGLGEDGTTHQPVEHLAACRAIPRLVTMRPGDANEVREAYRWFLGQRDRPMALVLSRQNVPTLEQTTGDRARGVSRGGYVLQDAKSGRPEVVLMGTGSELSLCVEARERLESSGVPTRVVSLPSHELFAEQDEAWRESVIPAACRARVAVEAGVRQGWDRWLGERGRFVGMTGFGCSAPAEQLYEHFRITVDRIVEEARAARAARP